MLCLVFQQNFKCHILIRTMWQLWRSAFRIFLSYVYID